VEPDGDSAHGTIGHASASLSLLDKIALIARNLPTAADYAALQMRAVNFTRQAPGSARELSAQQGVFTAACVAQGWTAGGPVGQIGDGLLSCSAFSGQGSCGCFTLPTARSGTR
jgi:hypothetical protein